MAVITGRVVTLAELPAVNVRVELRDTLSGISLHSAYTNTVGQFEIHDVAPGHYLVVATSGLDEVSEGILVSHMFSAPDLILRLPRTFAHASAGDANSVSVQQIKVPLQRAQCLEKRTSRF